MADHDRIWGWHQTISDPEHVAAARVLRRDRLGVIGPARELEVATRRLSDYDTALGIDLDQAHRGSGGVHLVFRGPHGGTLRVLRSMLGRADAAATAKAARLTEVDEPTFWAGPEAHARGLAQPADPGTESTDNASRAYLDDDAAAAREGRERPTHDQIIAVVLAVHVAMDQPLRFSQVVALADVELTRSQVSGASGQLCRDGQLVRIRGPPQPSAPRS